MAIDVLEIDAMTGEISTRDFTAEEKLQREAAIDAMAKEKQEIEKKRQAALDKLTALGLDVEDLQALGISS